MTGWCSRRHTLRSTRWPYSWWNTIMYGLSRHSAIRAAQDVLGRWKKSLEVYIDCVWKPLLHIYVYVFIYNFPLKTLFDFFSNLVLVAPHLTIMVISNFPYIIEVLINKQLIVDSSISIFACMPKQVQIFSLYKYMHEPL